MLSHYLRACKQFPDEELNGGKSLEEEEEEEDEGQGGGGGRRGMRKRFWRSKTLGYIVRLIGYCNSCISNRYVEKRNKEINAPSFVCSKLSHSGFRLCAVCGCVLSGCVFVCCVCVQERWICLPHQLVDISCNYPATGRCGLACFLIWLHCRRTASK